MHFVQAMHKNDICAHTVYNVLDILMITQHIRKTFYSFCFGLMLRFVKLYFVNLYVNLSKNEGIMYFIQAAVS